MKRITWIRTVAGAGLSALGLSLASGQTVPTVLIGHAGNPADATTGLGAVASMYSISQSEVTNAQYAAFLNAVAATDTFGVYSSSMSDSFGGIVRTGSPGAYVYTTVSARADYPVNYVTFWDACRFANWLHNGQPVGAQDASTTEDGAYTLTSAGITANTITRNAGWIWAVPGENEWYKAAYYQPSSDGGDSDGYWLYPTSSNTISPSMANYSSSGLGDCVAAGTYAPNYFGTVDMGGNVYEWTEVISGSSRLLRGGAFVYSASTMQPTSSLSRNAGSEQRYMGIRVVKKFVPCPADFDLSGFVDSDDFIAFASQFELGCIGPGEGAFGSEPACFKSADFDESGFVDSDDFISYVDAFATPCEN